MDDPGLEIPHPGAVGIDIGNESHFVSVPPGRKTDVRATWRVRVRLVEEASRHVQHRQKALTTMKAQVSQCRQRHHRADRTSHRPDDLRDARVKASREEIARRLEGNCRRMFCSSCNRQWTPKRRTPAARKSRKAKSRRETPCVWRRTRCFAARVTWGQNSGSCERGEERPNRSGERRAIWVPWFTPSPTARHGLLAGPVASNALGEPSGCKTLAIANTRCARSDTPWLHNCSSHRASRVIRRRVSGERVRRFEILLLS